MPNYPKISLESARIQCKMVVKLALLLLSTDYCQWRVNYFLLELFESFFIVVAARTEITSLKIKDITRYLDAIIVLTEDDKESLSVLYRKANNCRHNMYLKKTDVAFLKDIYIHKKLFSSVIRVFFDKGDSVIILKTIDRLLGFLDGDMENRLNRRNICECRARELLMVHNGVSIYTIGDIKRKLVSEGFGEDLVGIILVSLLDSQYLVV